MARWREFVAGHADDAIAPQEAPRLRAARILLADMDAVGAGGERQIRPVVEDEGDVGARANGEQARGGTKDDFVGDALEAELQARHVARLERRRQRALECDRLEGGRGHEIKPAGRKLAQSLLL